MEPNYNPPLTQSHENALNDVYYTKLNFFGANKLYYVLKDAYPSLKFTTQQITSWLNKQEVHQLNKKFRTLNLEKTPQEIKIPRNLKIGIDLIDLSAQPYKGHNYILTIVEENSRYIWLYALKQKSVANVLKYLNPLLTKYPQINIIKSDNGTEFAFDNLLVQPKGKPIIHIYSRPYTPTDNAMTERNNGNIQAILRKYRTATNKNDWSEILNDIAENINTSINRVIRTTPQKYFEKLLKEQQIVRKKETLLEIGTRVRLINLKKIKQGDLSTEKYRWSEDIYSIYKRTAGKAGNKYFVQLNDIKKKGSYGINYLQVIPGVEIPPTPKSKEQRIIGKRKNAEIKKLIEKGGEAPKNIKRR